MQIFPAFCFNIDTYRMSPHIYSEWEKIGPECKHFLCSGRQIIPTVFLVSLYGKFKVKSWLNNYEDMKLVAPTHVNLFH